MVDEKLFENMEKHISPSRLEKIRTVSSQRTNYVSLVLNNIFYTQNLSAVVRTCDCFGIQNLYVTGDSPSTHVNKHVAQGAYNWVDIHRLTHRPEEETLQNLKDQGYRIAVTLLEPGAKDLYDFDLSAGKVAVVMGNERDGVSPVVKEMADEYLYIPMSGFTQSLNLSVSAAVILSELTAKLQNSSLDWRLSDEELMDLRYRWMKNSIRRSSKIEEEYLVRLSHPNDQHQ